MNRFFAIALSGLVAGFVGAWLILRFGDRLGLTDHPNQRSSHRQPTPKGGGGGIVIGVLGAAFIGGAQNAFCLPVVGIAILGLASDRFEIQPLFRLLVQLVLAGILLGRLHTMGFDQCAWIFWPFIVLFIVATANFYNFMDGIDGIATLCGIVGFSLLAWNCSRSGADEALVGLAIGSAFACAGFLPMNLPTARVFMGDTGSLLLGFLFAAIVVASADSLLQMVCNAACLLPFYLDELSTMALRLRDGEPLTRPHRRHLYQLLANEMGIPHARVALGYAAAQAVMGTSIILAAGFHPAFCMILLAGYAVGFCLLSVRVRRRAAAASRL